MTGNYDHNNFDGDFGRRLFLSFVLCPIGMFLVSMLEITLRPLVGGVLSFFALMTMLCIMIASIADYLRLVPFPIIHFLSKGHADQDEEKLQNTLVHTFFALPLSFTSAALISLMSAVFLTGDAGSPIAVLLIGPLTIVFLILNLDTQSPAEALGKSVKTFITILALMLAFGPEPVEESRSSGTASVPAEQLYKP